MSVTFAVETVPVARDTLPALPKAVGDRIGGDIVTGEQDVVPVIDADRQHALVRATYLAWSQHRPLLLTPDAIWLTLAQGMAAHVNANANAEALRGHFVRHQGRKKLSVIVADRVAGAYAKAVSDFGTALSGELGKGIPRLMTSEFSTTTNATRTASQVVMMNAFQAYFEYEMLCICGIPRVTLAGTVSDWREIRRRITALSEHGLEWWAEKLGPIADQWVRAADGAQDGDFWRRMYSYRNEVSCIPSDDTGEWMEGWLGFLFPYLKAESGGTVRNPFQAKLRPYVLPGDMTAVHVVQRSEPSGPATDLTFVGGFLGVSQSDDLALSPVVGWALRTGKPEDRRKVRVEAVRAPEDWTG